VLNWLGRARGSRAASGNRGRTFRPQLEQLDERLLLSLSSAITIPHNGWIERDWYTVQNIGDPRLHEGAVVEFQGTSQRNLGLTVGPNGDHPVHWDLSASVDPKTGSGEVFVADTFSAGMDACSCLELIDSAGGIHTLLDYSPWIPGDRTITGISATRDG